jgi:muramoyltetrapeptide carboxypeptidase
MTPLKPKALRRGDTISVVVPAGPVNRRRIDRALRRLDERGFRTKTYGDIYRSRDYLAGEDATRAYELMAAFADPETTAVWCARGGYGVARLLDRLDFHAIHRHSKLFIGFSDITALHVAIGQRCGLVTIHAPNLQDGFGKSDDMSAATEAALWRAVLANADTKSEPRYEFDLTGLEGVALRTIRGGIATARLTGGNLSVISGLMGTPFEIETAGRILFLEDVDERPYRLDRYLSQLWLAGKLQAAAGVILGTFSYDEDEPPDFQAAVNALVDEYLRRLDVPVIAGFPAGHTQHNLALPMGALVGLDATERRVSVLESPVASEG